MSDLPLEAYLLALMLASMACAGGAIGLHVWRTKAKSAAAAATEGAAFRSGAVVPAEALHESGLHLVNEAAAILKIIRQQIDAGDRFSNSLAEADSRLLKTSAPDQLRAVVKFLVAENAKMQQEQNELRARLEQSQSQIELLRFKVAEAEDVSLRDALTSVSNRRGFDLALSQGISEAHSLKQPMCLVIADLDHFKKLNDTHGHPVGDAILKTFAAVLQDNIRAGDTVARYGGEEFAIILTRSDMQGAARVCERMRVDIASRKLTLDDDGVSSGSVAITASFGIAQCLGSDTPETLVKRADLKLYEAKSGGRNRIVIDKSAFAA